MLRLDYTVKAGQLRKWYMEETIMWCFYYKHPYASIDSKPESIVVGGVSKMHAMYAFRRIQPNADIIRIELAH
jgi:hypothetical protein